METSRPAETRRIASLLPAATEIVCALGFEANLVGVSHECDFPRSVRSKPILTSTKVLPHGSSAAIDRGVREVLRTALAVYDIDVEGLARAAPDVIVTQDLCDVCAVPFADVQRAARELVPGATLVNLHPTRLEDLWTNVRQVAAALGAELRAEQLILELRARLDSLAARARALARRPTVLTIEWIEPVMIGGTWMPELAALAGGRPLVTRPGDHAPTLTRKELARLSPAPEVVLVKPCGFTLDRSLLEFPALRAMLAGLPWPALRTGDLFLADGNAYFNRPGPRLVESAEILAAVLHPFDFRDFGSRHAAAYVRIARP